MIKKNDDIELVKAIQAGKQEAFEKMALRHQKMVYRLAFNITHDHHDAEDVTQEVFLRVYIKIDTFLGKSAFSSWIYRITLNVSFMKLKKRKKIKNHNSEPYYQLWFNPEFDCPRKNSLTSELNQLLLKHINRLSEKERAVFILRDIEDFNNEKVSELLNLSIPAVKSRLFRARSLMRKWLIIYCPELAVQQQ